MKSCNFARWLIHFPNIFPMPVLLTAFTITFTQITEIINNYIYPSKCNQFALVCADTLKLTSKTLVHFLHRSTCCVKASAAEVSLESPLTATEFWLVSSDRFHTLSSLALRYLSAPSNSVEAERSVSQYTAASSTQRQSTSKCNPANQVIIAKNSKTVNNNQCR